MRAGDKRRQSSEAIEIMKTDIRDLPAYTIGEAAHFLNLSDSTVRWWSIGRDHYPSLIDPASRDGRPVLLSFFNLVELHILAVIRREHEVKMAKVRSAIDYLKNRLRIQSHPLIRQEMQTDGVSLFIERLDDLINISQNGQRAMREVLEAALKRIDRDPKGLPVRLYPFTRSALKDAPSLIVIDANLSGGRPVIAGTGLATEIIAERYKAGDSVRALVEDYGRTAEEIEEAIRCEFPAAA